MPGRPRAQKIAVHGILISCLGSAAQVQKQKIFRQ